MENSVDYYIRTDIFVEKLKSVIDSLPNESTINSKNTNGYPTLSNLDYHSGDAIRSFTSNKGINKVSIKANNNSSNSASNEAVNQAVNANQSEQIITLGHNEPKLLALNQDILGPSIELKSKLGKVNDNSSDINSVDLLLSIKNNKPNSPTRQKRFKNSETSMKNKVVASSQCINLKSIQKHNDIDLNSNKVILQGGISNDTSNNKVIHSIGGNKNTLEDANLDKGHDDLDDCDIDLPEDDFENSSDEDNDDDELSGKTSSFISNQMNQVQNKDNSKTSLTIKMKINTESNSIKKKKTIRGTKNSSILRNKSSTLNKTSNLTFDDILEQNRSNLQTNTFLKYHNLSAIEKIDFDKKNCFRFQYLG